MAFSQATINQVFAPRPTQTHVFISWASSSPSGTWFQVYVNQQLAWSGTATCCLLPIQMIPPGPARVDIGTVAVGEETTSFASSLPAGAQPPRPSLLAIGDLQRGRSRRVPDLQLGLTRRGHRLHDAAGHHHRLSLGDHAGRLRIRRVRGRRIRTSPGHLYLDERPARRRKLALRDRLLRRRGQRRACPDDDRHDHRAAPRAGLLRRRNHAAHLHPERRRTDRLRIRRLRTSNGKPHLEPQPPMSNTYTPNTKLAMPAIGDTGWSVPVNGNATAPRRPRSRGASRGHHEGSPQRLAQRRRGDGMVRPAQRGHDPIRGIGIFRDHGQLDRRPLPGRHELLGAEHPPRPIPQPRTSNWQPSSPGRHRSHRSPTTASVSSHAGHGPMG